MHRGGSQCKEVEEVAAEDVRASAYARTMALVIAELEYCTSYVLYGERE